MAVKKQPPRRKPGSAARPAARHEMVYVPLGSVKLWPRNPRRNDAAAEKLAVLVKEHGFNTPLVVWRETGFILKGNTGLKAARIAGLAEVPVIYKSFADEDDAFDYAVSDNKASEWAEWDEVAFAEMLARRERVPAEALARRTGFTAEEIEGLRTGWALGAPGEFPEVGEDIETEHRCPKCGYEWSGKAK